MSFHKDSSGWAARVAALIACLVLVACRPVPPAPPAPTSAPPQAGTASKQAPIPVQSGVKTGGIAVIAVREDPAATWDSMFNTDIGLAYPGSSVLGEGNLVRSCPEDLYKVCPNLAESWESSADFTQFTFKLRDNVLWHDGTPFTPADVKFWAELAYNGAKSGDKTRPPARFKPNLGQLKDVEVLDDHRVRFTLSVPTPYYLDLLAIRGMTIAHPRHLMEPRIQQGDVMVSPADVGYVGLGPFKLLKHERGSIIQVRRFDKYWEKDAQGRSLPYLDGIDFPIISDFSTVLASFRTGQLDGGTRGGGFTVLPEQKSNLQQALGDKVWFAELGGTRQVLWFNVLRDSPLQDVRVRRAISLWMDKREGLQGVLGGYGKLAPLLDPASPWPNPDWMSWPGYNEATRDADKTEARRLMNEAGYANGFDISILGQAPWVGRYEWIQGNLAGLGIRVALDLVDIPTHGQRTQRRDYFMQAARGGTTTTFPEGLAALIDRASLANGSYPVHEDEKITEYFARFSSVRTQEERVQVYRELERYFLLDQVYGVVLYDEIQATPYRSHLTGMPVPPEDVIANLSFATTWLDR